MVEISSIVVLLIIVVIVTVVVMIAVRTRKDFKYPNSIDDPTAFWLGGSKVGGWYAGGWPWVYPNY